MVITDELQSLPTEGGAMGLEIKAGEGGDFLPSRGY